MPNPVHNIVIPPDSVVDFFASQEAIDAGLSVGDKVKFSVIGQGRASIYFGSTAPSQFDNATGYFEIKPSLSQESKPTDSGVFIYSRLGCTVNVRVENISPVGNGGVPDDVTRALRIEGHNQNLAGGNVWCDIWGGGANTIPEPSKLGQQLQVLSSSNSDTELGIGAQIVRLEYLNSLDELTSEDIALDGTTPALTNATNITDIIDFYNVSTGSNSVSVGDIDVTDVGNSSLIFNRIDANGNKSMSTLRHLLPSSTFYLTQMVVSGDTKGTDVILRANSNDSGEVFGDDNWLFQVPVTMSDAPAVINFNPAIVIPSTARMKVSARGTNAGNRVSVFIGGWVKV